MSKIYDTIYYGYIRYINLLSGRVVEDKLEPIMYRFISLDNQFLFAEEIATGNIFPVGIFLENKNKQKRSFKEFSYAGIVNYYVEVWPIVKHSNLGEISIDEKIQKKNTCVPTIDEVNGYLAEKKGSIEFHEKIKIFEIANEYFCELDIIKRRIAELKANKSSNIGYYPVCDMSSIEDFGFDLSAQDELCHAIGRDQELERIIESTVIKGKSILLIGDSGTGKTAIAEELARQIKFGLNPWLQGKMIISINANSLVAGTRYRGMFEENMQKLVQFARKNKGKVILFIDEVHALYGLGEVEYNRSNDAINILKPYISNRDILIIGATTKGEYADTLAKDEAFCGRFDKLNINKLPDELIIDIILEYIERLKANYGIDYNFINLRDLIIKVLDLTDIKHQVSYNEPRVSNIRLAKDIFEDAFAHAKYKVRKVVREADVIEAMIKCDRISTVVRKRLTLELKTMVIENDLNPLNLESKIISFPKSLTADDMVAGNDTEHLNSESRINSFLRNLIKHDDN